MTFSNFECELTEHLLSLIFGPGGIAPVPQLAHLEVKYYFHLGQESMYTVCKMQNVGQLRLVSHHVLWFSVQDECDVRSASVLRGDLQGGTA